MNVQGLAPILNVSDMAASFAWFEKVGWKKDWEWEDPPTFGSVVSGAVEIFLCLDGQGSRGGADGYNSGVWMTWWLESPVAVDAAWQRAVQQGLTVTDPPADRPWNVREFHVRHPDGHTFRVSARLEEE